MKYAPTPLRLGLLLTLAHVTRLSAQCPDGTPPPCKPTVRSMHPVSNSLAVLYFDNLSQDSADAYLADGLTEEIIARLGQIESLIVKSRYAVGRYRGGRSVNSTAIGRTLGVAHLVTGSVRRAGNTLRVSVELAYAASGDREWGDEYDRSDVDLLVIEEEIAKAVASAVAGRLQPRERARLAALPSHIPAAYDHFMRGDYFLSRRTPVATARAIEEYATATLLDPRFAAAYARRALAYETMLDWGWDYGGFPAESLLARGLGATDSALRVDSGSADAWMARALLLAKLHPRTFDDVRASFEQARRFEPRNAEVLHQYGVTLCYMGDDSAAALMLRQAATLEPERAPTLVQLGILAIVERKPAEARVWLDSALSVDSTFYYGYSIRAGVRALQHDTAGVRADGEQALRFGVAYQLPGRSALIVAGGLGPAAVRATIADTLHPTVREALFAGAALTLLGARDEALTLLERAHPRGGALWFSLRTSHFDALRDDPRFQRLVEDSRPPGAPR